MESKFEDIKDINVDELFKDIDVSNLTKPLNSYLKTLDSFYTEYSSNHHPALFRWFVDFNPDNFNDGELDFTVKALRKANYDDSALRDEQVILFSQPMIVSEVNCANVPNNKNVNALRLISFIGSEKKFITHKTASSSNKLYAGSNAELVTTYKVHETALGMILPRNSKFHSFKIASFQSLHTDYDKLERTQKALQDASDRPKIAIQNISGKFNDINGLINTKRSQCNLLDIELNSLGQEQSYLEGSIESHRVHLDKVKKDTDSATRKFDKINNEISDAEDKLEETKAQLKVESNLLKQEKGKLLSLKKDLANEINAVLAVKEELEKAKNDKNTTTLDSLGHSKETEEQLRGYYCYAALTFFCLVCMALYVYSNGQNLNDILPDLVDVNVWDILLSRLPLVAATTLIIGGLSGVFFYLVRQIVSLNTDKMAMLKAGILARQITESLDCGEMSEADKLKMQRNTKIELITQVFAKNENNQVQNKFIVDALKALKS
ncbi:hypothetical protein [Vibrio comitans]|uniref:Uncharacterized protein n=1 Tax=Vibrio comitans NBRC 102076 TaxID=1219078 RepID=A0A4Y3IQN5_9VIBR|nr:hypothetical protein [Vibrio comitans]GEA61497.1 hypothetical protein VCO01S_26900 [Vibrio comitans NBRC 102076]